MVRLRRLEEKDAPFMLEWMHDVEIQKGFKKNMLGMTNDDAIKFCLDAIVPNSISDVCEGGSIHYAIVNENDEYLGTVSLKEIDAINHRAEYAIVIRRCVQGKGVGYTATKLILSEAFHKYKLHKVYLSVYANNTAAIKMYERSGFVFEGEFREHFCIGNEYVNWRWYSILENEYGKAYGKAKE